MTQTLGQQLATPQGYAHWMGTSMLATVNIMIAVFAAARSRFLDHLGDEPLALDDLAAASGVKADRLGRLVRFLASQDFLTIAPDGRIAHTPASRQLRSDHPGLAQAAVLIGAATVEHGLSLDKALRDGGSSFTAHHGMDIFDYISRNPAFGEAFGKYMSFTTGLAEQVIFARHSFAPFTFAVDVGGNHGTLLLRLLADHPDARGILFDMPAVVAQAAERLSTDPAGSRVAAVGGSFFESVPAGGDLYLMKQILHDWDDTECMAILANVRKAIVPGGRLAIIDRLLPETIRPHPAWYMDLSMMLWSTGQERKLSEFTALLDRTGFRLDRVTEDENGPSVIEAVPV